MLPEFVSQIPVWIPATSIQRFASNSFGAVFVVPSLQFLNAVASSG
jgi:hypothetical protein